MVDHRVFSVKQRLDVQAVPNNALKKRAKGKAEPFMNGRTPLKAFMDGVNQKDRTGDKAAKKAA